MMEDWVEVEFKKAVKKISTAKFKLKQKEYSNDGKIPVVDQGKDLIGGFTNDHNRIIRCKLPVIVFGDHTKNIKFINFQFVPGADGTKVLEPQKNILPKYLSYVMHILVHKIKDKGYARHYQHIEKQLLPLPPLPIQRAIVARIEELFSSLDQGVADLQRAQEQLRVYRQAVLKKAFEGELTREWREQQTDLPSAEDLLAQIQEERQRYYEQQLVDWEAAVQEWEAEGKVGKKPRKPSKLKTYNNSVRELNLNIPEDWLFEHIGNLSIGVEYGSSAKSKSEGKVPVIRMGNLQDGKIDWNDLKYSNDDDEINKYILKKGDVLFNRTNSPELVGKTAEYKGERPAVFAGYLIRINHLSQLIRSPYLNWFLNSFPAKEYAAFVKTDGVNQSNINGTKLSNYPIPFCSISEQKQIIKEIESRLSICDQVEANIQESLAKAEALRQSILKKAFEGNLLTAAEITACRQEADYEPAAVLLARMKVEQKK